MEQENNTPYDEEIEEFEFVEPEEIVEEEDSEGMVEIEQSDSEYDSAEDTETLLKDGTFAKNYVTFDISLPSAHSYLSEDWDELSGRTVHEEGSIISMPILSFPGVVLMPGQQLPLHLFRNADIAMIKYCLERDKTFGQLNIPKVSSEGAEVLSHTLSQVGTTVEILAVKQEENMDMKVKTLGRQRFEVLSKRVDVGGNILATVRILPDKNLPPLLSLLNHSYPYLRHHHDEHIWDDGLKKDVDGKVCNDDDLQGNQISDGALTNSDNTNSDHEGENKKIEKKNKIMRKKSEKEIQLEIKSKLCEKHLSSLKDKKKLVETKTTYPEDLNIYKKEFLHSDKNEDIKKTSAIQKTSTPKIIKKVYRHSTAMLTHWPEWLYKQYDCQLLMQSIRHEMKTWNDKMLTATVPQDPDHFSYWVASSLPLDDVWRMELLRINSCQQRLRFELSIMKKCTVMCCNRCKQMLARKNDVFSMSSLGPLGTYVNPGGHVHETLTVYQVSGLHHVGKPSTQASWFPGYAWTIVECSTCHKHTGWRFTVADKALKHIKPQRFWGLCRAGLVPGLINGEQEFNNLDNDDNNNNIYNSNYNSFHPII